MLPALLALAALNLLFLVVLLVRSPAKSAETPVDLRLIRLLDADLPAQMARFDGRSTSLESALRAEISGFRSEASAEATRTRETADAANAALRREVLASVQALGETLHAGLDRFRGDHKADADQLRTAMDAQLVSLAQRFGNFTTESLQHHAQSREALHVRLSELGAAQGEHQEKLRGTVEARLDRLNEANAAKLEEMRQTVDEKLHATLQSRLTESFGQVTDQLTKVHAGLGEMNTLSAGVSDLNRIFSNVKSRGGFAEVQLGKLLEQVLAPGQYVENARIKENTFEAVEYAVRFPGSGGDVLLPIDAKFPREDWERLESAYENGSSEQVDGARKMFDAAIRTEGKRICSKYIHEPVTTPYAIMFLPTEGLYAEVLRRDGLQADLHLNCKVMVAGPSNLYALLTSFQLGFRMLNLQKKGDEVWNVLSKTQTEFKNFEVLMSGMEKQVGTVQNTIQKLGVRTRAINRTLRDVGATDSNAVPPTANAALGFDGLLPVLAAADED